jgi:hypothetical protein
MVSQGPRCALDGVLKQSPRNARYSQALANEFRRPNRKSRRGPAHAVQAGVGCIVPRWAYRFDVPSPVAVDRDFVHVFGSPVMTTLSGFDVNGYVMSGGAVRNVDAVPVQVIFCT